MAYYKKNVRDVRSFMGMEGSYRISEGNFSLLQFIYGDGRLLSNVWSNQLS